MNKTNLDDVPADLLAKMVSLLPTNGALSLTRASKKLNRDIGFSIINPGLQLFHEKSWHGDYRTGDIPRRSSLIPNLFGTQTHSICLECDFVDQGWGNLKGQIFIVADNGEPSYNPIKGIQNRRVVASSPGAEHRLTHVKLSFQPKSDEKYHLWYRVGGGGGHSLHMSNAKVFYAIQGDPDQGFKRAASFLDSAGLWGDSSGNPNHVFCQSMIDIAVESLENAISNGHDTDTLLTAFFQSHGLGSVNEASLRALRLLLGKITKYHEMTEQTEHLEPEEIEEYSDASDDSDMEIDVRVDASWFGQEGGDY